MRPFAACLLVSTALAWPALPAHASNCARTSTGLTPLDELGAADYRGSPGGLYPAGANVRPPEHEAAGQAVARAIEPLDGVGRPSPGGRYALLSIGMSNATQEFSRFVPLANADPKRDPRLVVVDGAQGSVTANRWANPSDPAWAVAAARLAASGVTPAQVAALWVKLADPGPTNGWPAYAQRLRDESAAVLRNARQLYPNLRVAYLSSRIYAGYASTALNPEPYAYESGFAVKWTIELQLAGSAALNHDPARGQVNAPWVAWGPYLWADGMRPRADGLTWSCAELDADGTHPSPAGAAKVATRLQTFMRTDSTAARWYMASSEPDPPAAQPGPAPGRRAFRIKGRLRCRDGRRLRGRVQPATAGGRILLQRRRKKARWSAVGRAVVDRRGRFALRPRTCRGRVRILWRPAAPGAPDVTRAVRKLSP